MKNQECTVRPQIFNSVNSEVNNINKEVKLTMLKVKNLYF